MEMWPEAAQGLRSSTRRRHPVSASTALADESGVTAQSPAAVNLCMTRQAAEMHELVLPGEKLTRLCIPAGEVGDTAARRKFKGEVQHAALPARPSVPTAPNVGTSERVAWIGLIARKSTSIPIIFSLWNVSTEHSKIPSRLAQSRMEKASLLVRNASTAKSSGTSTGELDAATELVWGWLALVPEPGSSTAASPRPGGISEVHPLNGLCC